MSNSFEGQYEDRVGNYMRKEASLKQWKELYEVTARIKSLSPWTYLWDSDLIAIKLPEREEPLFCSIMGRGGTLFGIATYDGMEGLADFSMIASGAETGIPLEYIMLEQSNLSCYFGDREEVPKEQKKVIKELALKFRGSGNWIYFESYKTGYIPYILDKEEVLLLINVYKNLFMALIALIEHKMKVDFDHGMILWRTFNDESQLWLNFEAPLPVAEKTYPHVELTDQLQKKKLKNRPKVNTEIILELSYLNIAIIETGYERPINPLTFFVMDALDGTIIHMTTLKPGDDLPYEILSLVAEFILEYGKMKCIITRIPIIQAVLEDTCQYCGIKLVEEDLRFEMVDDFIAGLRHNLMK